MALDLYIIRHGDRADYYDDYAGGPNPPISDKGRWQSLRVAERMGEIGLTHIYVSPAKRALETALPIHARTALPMDVWPALCETGPGHWRRGVARRWDPEDPLAVNEEAAAAIDDDLPYFDRLSEIPQRYPGARVTQPFDWPDAWWLVTRREAREAAYHRTRLALEALKEIHLGDEAEHGAADGEAEGGDARAAVVCHTNIANVMVNLLAEAEPSNHGRFRFDTCSISCVRLRAERPPQLMYLNDRRHLEGIS